MQQCPTAPLTKGLRRCVASKTPADADPLGDHIIHHLETVRGQPSRQLNIPPIPLDAGARAVAPAHMKMTLEDLIASRGADMHLLNAFEYCKGR